MADNPKKVIEILVNPSTVIGSTYSQAARVTISDVDMTIEFAYVHPSDASQGQTVARVTMPVLAGVDLANTILSLNKIREKHKEGSKND